MKNTVYPELLKTDQYSIFRRKRGISMSDFESPLRFPDPHSHNIKQGEFVDEYESCLVELGLIIENTFDPVLRGKLEALMRDVPEWLK